MQTIYKGEWVREKERRKETEAGLWRCLAKPACHFQKDLCSFISSHRPTLEMERRRKACFWSTEEEDAGLCLSLQDSGLQSRLYFLLRCFLIVLIDLAFLPQRVLLYLWFTQFITQSGIQLPKRYERENRGKNYGEGNCRTLICHWLI